MPCGWPSTTLRIIVSVPRCISWACTWPARRSISVLVRASPWQLFTIRCAWPKRWRCSTYSLVVESTGAGRGFDATEFKAFGVPPQESHGRFREAVEIVLAAWQNERLTWDGDYWHFENIEVLPKPLQQPHPHTWIAAGSPDSVCWAAAQGYSIMLGPHTHYTDLGQKREIYRKKLEAHGHIIAGRDIPMARLLAVAETDQAAEAIARRGAQWLVDAYVNPAKAANAVAMVTSRHDQNGGILDPMELYLDGIIIMGRQSACLTSCSSYMRRYGSIICSVPR